ncbi:MAG: DNA polymerase IV [Thaumarchaeota archaeon]|nr:DNA polymerase IV [Nitrososphaerota archaeon]
MIGHLDLDYFYAQVEEVGKPSLKDSPVLVCVFSGRNEDSGVVSTANYKAREYGVRSGMPISQAKKKLLGREAIFIPMDHHKYEIISERIMKQVRQDVDLFEQTGIDEAFFDITKSSEHDYDRAKSIASAMKARIFSSETLTCSVGIGPNKIVAKIASDFSKPDGLTIVTPTNSKRFLASLEVERLYGVGPKTSEILRRAGINTLGELGASSPEDLAEHFSRKLAVYLHDAANGENDEMVVPNSDITQLSRIVTLKRDTREMDEILRQLSPLVQDLQSRLISKNLLFKSITAIGILTDLSIKTKNRKIESPTNDQMTLDVQVRALFQELVSSVDLDLRRAGVRVADLINSADQTSLTQYLQ